MVRLPTARAMASRTRVERAVVGDHALEGGVGVERDGGVGHLSVDVEHLAKLGLERLEWVAAVLRCGVDGVDGGSGACVSSSVVSQNRRLQG